MRGIMKMRTRFEAENQGLLDVIGGMCWVCLVASLWWCVRLEGCRCQELAAPLPQVGPWCSRIELVQHLHGILAWLCTCEGNCSLILSVLWINLYILKIEKKIDLKGSFNGDLWVNFPMWCMRIKLYTAVRVVDRLFSTDLFSYHVLGLLVNVWLKKVKSVSDTQN